MDRLPVIYVRGYAGTTAGIDSQVDDPFYGFNYPADNLSKALFSAARLMGSTATDYGLDAGKVTGTLSGIV